MVRVAAAVVLLGAVPYLFRSAAGGRLAWWASGSLVPFLILWAGVPGEAVLEVSLFVAAGVVILADLRSGRGSRFLSWTVVALLLLCLIAAGNSNEPSVYLYLQGLRRTGLPLLMIPLGLYLRPRLAAGQLGKRSTYFVLGTTSGTLALLALHLGFGQRLWALPLQAPQHSAQLTETLNGVSRATGPFSGPFHLAVIACAVLAVFLVLVKFGPVQVVGVVSCLAIISLTLIRTAMIAAVIMVVVRMLTVKRHRRYAFTGVPAAFALGFVALVSLPLLGHRHFSGPGAMVTTLLTDHRFTSRYDLWHQAAVLVYHRPWSGHGLGSAADVISQQFTRNGYVGINSHNMLLKYAVELGIPGALVLLTILGWAVWTLVRGRSRNPWLAVLMLIVIATFGLTGSFVDALPSSLVVLFLLGAALAPKAAEPRMIDISSSERTVVAHA